MPVLSDHHSSKTTKLLILGETGTGKTGALASLADAGYNIRILDLDNGVDILANLLRGEKSPYSKNAISRVHYRTIREPMRNLAGRLVPREAFMWKAAMGQLADWKEYDEDGKESKGPDGKTITLGPVTSWGERDILVVDTLSALSRGAYNMQAQANGKLGAEISGFEGQRIMYGAQQLIESFLDMIVDTSVKCNVIINSHITYVRDPGMPKPKEDEADPIHGYPAAIGRALSPRIGRYFNSTLLFRIDGYGEFAKRKIHTNTNGLIAAKNSAPLTVAKSYGIEHGLAEYFRAVRGE